MRFDAELQAFVLEANEFDQLHADVLFARHEAAQLKAENERLRNAVRSFLDHEDTHKPGPVVDDPYAGEVQICGDGDCALYWPCPVEELRRVFESVT